MISETPRKSRGLSRSLSAGDMIWAIPTVVLFVVLFSYLSHMDQVARDAAYAAHAAAFPPGCEVDDQNAVSRLCDTTSNDLTWQMVSQRFGLRRSRNDDGHWIRLGNDAAEVLCFKDRPTCGVEAYVHGKFFVPTNEQLRLLKSANSSGQRVRLGQQSFGYQDMF